MLEAVICFKAVDGEGVVRFGSRATEGLRVPEAVGMLQLAAADQTKQWVDDDGED